MLLRLAGVLTLASCASLKDPADLARDIAIRGRLDPAIVSTATFDLQIFHRGLTGKSETLHVYIEGDGHAFKRRQRISDDPTPENPVALMLAAKDPSAAVLYIARPCQYTGGLHGRGCGTEYWSSHRYAEEVIHATNQVISRALTTSKPKSLGLIGYSGGAAVAVLVAARRNDVDWLVTVAGNLDHSAWTGLHNVTPLHGSLNPADYTHRLQSLPQLHLVGEDDETIPVAVSKSYLGRFSDPPSQLRVTVIPGFDHNCCWAREWASLLYRHQFRERPSRPSN